MQESRSSRGLTTTFCQTLLAPGLDITDDHIDGTARFANGNTIVTLHRDDFLIKDDYDILASATNAHGEPFQLVHLPLTAKKVPGANEYGLYTNYYVGNDVVIFPIFNDQNDEEAAQVIQSLYPGRELVRIDFTQVYGDGGVAHCVTMQQPAMM